MKVGDLVQIRENADTAYAGKVGVVTETHGPSMAFPRLILAVTFPDGDKLSGITQSWARALNETR